MPAHRRLAQLDLANPGIRSPAPAVRTLEHAAPDWRDTVHAVAFSQDGSRVIAGSMDGAIRQFDPSSMSLVEEIQATDPEHGVTRLAFDGDRLVVGT